MKLEDVLLNGGDLEQVNCEGCWNIDCSEHTNENKRLCKLLLEPDECEDRYQLTDRDEIIAKAQCLKLLAVLNKEQLLVHSFLFPSGQHNPDCRTCELEKLLKEG